MSNSLDTKIRRVRTVNKILSWVCVSIMVGTSILAGFRLSENTSAIDVAIMVGTALLAGLGINGLQEQRK